MVPDVPPGRYVLEVGAQAVNEKSENPDWNSHDIGTRNLEVVIPANAASEFPLGTVEVPVRGE